MCGNIQVSQLFPNPQVLSDVIEQLFFCSFLSVFVSIKHSKAANAITFPVEESLNINVSNRIDFANAILNNEKN